MKGTVPPECLPVLPTLVAALWCGHIKSLQDKFAAHIMHLSPCHQDALLHLTGLRGLSAAALLNTVCADPPCLEVKVMAHQTACSSIDCIHAMQTTAETAVATKQEAMTETPASPGKTKKKKDAAGSSAQVAASPAGPSTQDDAQEVTPLSHHTMCILEWPSSKCGSRLTSAC